MYRRKKIDCPKKERQKNKVLDSTKVVKIYSSSNANSNSTMIGINRLHCNVTNESDLQRKE